MRTFLSVLLPISLLIQLSPADAAIEATVQHSAQPEIRNLDKQIVLEGIKFARFNIQYHREANKRYRWHNFIYPVVQEGSTACGFASAVIDLNQRAVNIHNPDDINKKLTKRGTECGLVGQAIKGVSFTHELLQNMRTAHAARRQGFAPRDAAAHVQGLVARIDKLLAERQRLVANIEADDQKLFVLEGRMLSHLRNQLIYEFKMFSAHSRDRQWQENSYYILAAGQNFALMGASIANIQGYQIPRNTPKASITNIAASSVAVVAPIARTLAGISVRHYWQWRLDKLLPTKRDTPRTMDELQVAWQDLDDYLAQSKAQQADGATKLLGLDATLRRSARADEDLRREVDRIHHFRRVAQEQAISGPVIELANLARQICQETAYSSYRNDSHLSNRINLAGRISQVSGQSYSLVMTPTSAIKAAMLEHKLRLQGQLPSQLLDARMQHLDGLEKRVSALEIVPR